MDMCCKGEQIAKAAFVGVKPSKAKVNPPPKGGVTKSKQRQPERVRTIKFQYGSPLGKFGDVYEYPVSVIFRDFFIDMAKNLGIQHPVQLYMYAYFLCVKKNGESHYVKNINTRDTLGTIFPNCNRVASWPHLSGPQQFLNVAKFIQPPGFELPSTKKQLDALLLQLNDRRGRSMNLQYQERDCMEGEYEDIVDSINKRNALKSNQNCEQTGRDKFCCKEECPICMDAYTENNPAIALSCGDKVHMGCFLEWVERSGEKRCPMCNQIDTNVNF